MAMTVPIGGLSFLGMTIAFGQLGELVLFPAAAMAWLAGQGVVVPVAMVLAVATLHEKLTVLQTIGAFTFSTRTKRNRA
jgi:NAD/NADP transhydrogenase beta subunit